ncbi:MAG TPA: radical SAM protein [Syntrophobacteraceae bacterium]|nr:radical SAM protein [Syntrophobacteraceae bacterium]
MTDILLIQPPIRDFYLTAKRTIPYGLACIAAPLVSEGYSVEILDALASSRSQNVGLPLEMSFLRDFYSGPDILPFSMFYDFRRFGLDEEAIGERVANSGAFLAGISSLFTAYSDEAILTAEIVKRRRPEAVTVLGGHHPTEMPEEVLKHDCVDFIIRGEGEVSMALLAGAIRGERPLESVPGIGFKTSGGNYYIKPPAVLANLDEIPLPAIQLIDNGFYRRSKRRGAVIVSGRGCPLGCSYCSIGCSSWCGFRTKSVRRVIEEMKNAVFGAGARFIDFEDENISYRRQWFLDLLNEIKVQFQGCGLELRAMNGLFPATLDEEVICAMKAAGFTALNLSLCTTCREQLKRFRRPDVRGEFERSLQWAREYGLAAVAYIIVGAPGQDPKDSVADLLYLADKSAIAGVSVFYPAPGSADYEKCAAQNLLPPALSQMRSTALPISDTTTRKDSITLLRLGRILNFFKSLDLADRKDVLSFARQPAADTLPEKIPVSETEYNVNTQNAKRRAIGKMLLGIFLRDGVIYGVSPEGNLFRHPATDALCREFTSGILRIHEKYFADRGRQSL